MENLKGFTYSTVAKCDKNDHFLTKPAIWNLYLDHNLQIMSNFCLNDLIIPLGYWIHFDHDKNKIQIINF